MLDYRQHPGNAIGAGSQSLSMRARRLLAVPNEPDHLARMFSELATWMEQQDDISDLARDSVRGKVEMESRRAAFSPHLWSRGRAALRMLAEGSYTTYGSNGRLNVLRDFVHAPSTRTELPDGC